MRRLLSVRLSVCLSVCLWLENNSLDQNSCVTYRLKATNIKVKDLIGQCQIRIPKKSRCAHNNVKLLHSMPTNEMWFFLLSASLWLTHALAVKNVIDCFEWNTVFFSHLDGICDIFPIELFAMLQIKLPLDSVVFRLQFQLCFWSFISVKLTGK